MQVSDAAFLPGGRFVSVLSLVLAIFEQVIEIKTPSLAPTTDERFPVFVPSFGGNHSFDYHIVVVQIFHQWHNCVGSGVTYEYSREDLCLPWLHC